LAPSSSDSHGIVEIRRLPDALQFLLVRNIRNSGNIPSLFFSLTTVLCRDGLIWGFHPGVAMAMSIFACFQMIREFFTLK
jgi:hypothetical protein